MNESTIIKDNTHRKEPMDRVTIFRDLTADEINTSENQEKFSQLLTDAYPKFVEFCNSILTSSDASRIVDVSCYIEDGSITFETRTSSVETIVIEPTP